MAKLLKKRYEIDSKSKAILKALSDNPEGLRSKSISKFTDIKTRTLYNHLESLKEHKIIENIFPIWRLCHNYAHPSKLANLLNNNNIQAHKFSFILRLINIPNWWEKRENKLMKLKDYQFRPIGWGNNSYQMLQKPSFLIQFFSNSIVFINQKEYYAIEPYTAFIEALEDALEEYRFIEERFKFRFFNDGIPQFSIRSQHYVKLMDAIANHCKKTGKYARIEINEQLRAWVDLSEPFGLEFGHKNYAPEDASRYTEFVKDIIKNNPPSPSETQGMISQLTENQLMFNKNLEQHFAVLKGIEEAIKQLKDAIKEKLI